MKKHIPEISVIIPAYNAHKTIMRALNSIKLQGFNNNDLEVIISIDDNNSYYETQNIIPNIKLLRSKIQKQSGPGKTRNRALSKARGKIICFLDADDTWAKGYLKPLRYSALRYGLAFGQTEVLDEKGKKIIELKQDSVLTIGDFGKIPGSFHPVVIRNLAGPFLKFRSQDVGHSIQLLCNYNGKAKLLLGSKYQIWLNDFSITRSKGFSRKLDLDYKKWYAIFRKQKLQLKIKNDILKAFELRRSWNRRYQNHINTFEFMTFYEYISSKTN